ncbi:ubiquitin carboxyl-terminal hydrolase 40 [Aplysia californica]|uniref:Ubiquitin carboxyl-terminal hydrolase 40 n=1 Tax=Aplysia californica TaxID=6500 RepID=A0ABM0JNH0_APLCA|nr:ubiquitin carboxyl-terminal hydrolase 40 [Aplysia californica]
MFGNLFNEDSQMVGPDNLTTSSIPAPPAHRAECHLAGIDNLGATCYLNSLLQTLLYTPEFREKLFGLSERDLGRLQDKDNPGARVRVIPLQLQRLFSQLLLSDQQSVSTIQLTNSFGWTNHEEFQQHDVQELNRILFSAIEDSLMGTEGQNIIQELYHGTIVNQIICSKCKKVSEREEDFLDLTLAIAGLSGLESALNQCYRQVEVMDGRNQYRCETCGTYTDATKGAKLRKLPTVLTVSLLRFSYDFVKMSRYKENGRFTFPMELDMKPYSEKEVCANSDGIYELFSVVVHRGGAYGGHYFAYIRDIDSLGHWDLQNEVAAQPKADPQGTGLDVIECQSPVDLVENILGQESHGSMSIDRLCAEISKTTGVSWNKRFRKTYGPINKFLKSCSSFDYNGDSNWVSLRNTEQNDSGDSQTTDKQNKTGEEEEKKIEDNLKKGENRAPPSTKDKRPSSPEPEPGHRWFSFNDSRVSPISTHDIEKQFSGKESAYMLFYRLKSLNRPTEGAGDRAFNVPDVLVKEVEELNKSLEAQRQEYEAAINRVSLKIYHQEDFRYDGVLRSKSSTNCETEHFVIDIDRRSSLGQLRMEIMQRLESKPDYAMHDFSLHRLKPCCGGYHLFEEFEDESSSLQDLGLSADSGLFVWNGAVINEEFVATGEACEPIFLTVRDSDIQRLLAQVVLAKNKSLLDLYKVVVSATDLELREMKLSHLSELGDNGNHTLRALPLSDTVSLAESGLGNGSVLLAGPIDDSEAGTQPQKEQETEACQGNRLPMEPEWSITLQERLERLAGNLGQVTCRTAVARTRPSVSVKDFKVQAMNLLQVHAVSTETVRLREDHRSLGLKPPLREGLSLQDCGLSDGACVVLESGRPPQDTEMTISVNKVENGKLMSKHEFLVDRALTVQSLLQAACQLMDCEGNQWYLSKTDVYGDPSEALENLDVSLLDLLINDGDTLVLQPGVLVKKDEVCLTVLLVMEEAGNFGQEMGSGDRPGCVSSLNRQEEEDKIMLELASRLSVKDHVPRKDLNPLNVCLCPAFQQLFENPLVVPKATGVERLKEELLSTPQFQDLRIPTLNFMRLRVIENNRLKGVIRNSSQTLRHANSKEGVHLAIQILKKEETLGLHEILLMVAQKISGSRIYMPAQEFVWNSSAGVGAGDLKKAVASRFELPLHDILLAKYNPDTCVWTVLRDMPQKTVKNKGKKRGNHKTNIRQAPYYVQDGDLVGIKILSGDKGFLDADDFSTQEDIEKRLILQQIVEEKKRMREERKKMQAFDGFPSHRRPEVPLTIKVDKFS